MNENTVVFVQIDQLWNDNPYWKMIPGLMIDFLKNGCISYLYPIPE